MLPFSKVTQLAPLRLKHLRQELGKKQEAKTSVQLCQTFAAPIWVSVSDLHGRTTLYKQT